MQNNRARVLDWIQAGLIEEKNISQALQVADAQPNRQQWLAFTKQLLLWLSVVCAGAGVIFFFAYNWQALSRMSRFALVESAMLLSSFAYLRCSAHVKFKAALLMTMVLLTGSLLALVGQTYQTGADPWQLFMIWCALITPWVLVARSSIIWIFWVVLLNTASVLLLELDVRVNWFSHTNRTDMLMSLVLINTVLIVLFELWARAYQSKASLLLKMSLFPPRNRYSQQFILSLLTYFVCHWAIEDIFDRANSHYFMVIYLIVMALAYRFLIQDLFAMAVISLGFLSVSSAMLFKGLDVINADFFGYTLLGAVYILGASSLMGIYLKKLAKIYSLQQPQEQLTTRGKQS